MSYRAMPFVYLNMGGEMAYILEQRLQAQNVGNDKSIKVLCDIIATMFNKNCLELIFEPQELYSRAALRSFFEQIAHSSVMRLNEASMDKLFDLMTMAVKYQVLLCKEPTELVLVTLNHLDGVKAIFKDHRHIIDVVQSAHNLLMDNFVETPLWEMAAVRSEMLNYFLGARVKVSLMLREKRQLDDGRFVLFPPGPDGDEQIELPYSAVVPGSVRYACQGEVNKIDTFPVVEKYNVSPDQQKQQPGGTTVMLARGTTLGYNMYKAQEGATQVHGGSGMTGRTESPPAGNEMMLLTKLLSGINAGSSASKQTFDLDLFGDDNPEERKPGAKPKKSKDSTPVDKSVLANRKSLSSAMNEIKTEAKSSDKGEKPARKTRAKGEEMLELMDEAAASRSRPKSKGSISGASPNRAAQRSSSASKKPKKPA
ncbi:organic solute transport protein 1 domain-containing protein [Ditylenchus destructor]|nr:organic solute transport protein 1 domain-containing protein [Ditylenchus destructor]